MKAYKNFQHVLNLFWTVASDDALSPLFHREIEATTLYFLYTFSSSINVIHSFLVEKISTIRFTNPFPQNNLIQYEICQSSQQSESNSRWISANLFHSSSVKMKDAMNKVSRFHQSLFDYIWTQYHWNESVKRTKLSFWALSLVVKLMTTLILS